MAVVTCIGIVVHDLVFRTEEPLAAGEKNLASLMTPTVGGPAANAAAAVAALGGTARLVAKVGADAAGDMVLSDLESVAVDVSLIRRVEGAPTPTSSVIVDDSGVRTIINHSDPAIVDGVATPTLADIEGSGAVLVDMRWPAGARAGIRHAATLGLPVVVDFDLTAAGDHGDIVEDATHVVFSRQALAQAAGRRDIDEALAVVSERTTALVGVTLGSEGFRWRMGGVVHHQPAFDVQVVDTLGAGDVFHGAFALALAQGRPPEDAARVSSAAAAHTCTRASGTDRFPSREDVESLMEAT